VFIDISSKHAPFAIGFTDLDHLAERLMVFVEEWNTRAHPFNWSTKSEVLVMAKYQVQPLLVPAADIPFLFSAVADFELSGSLSAR